jgi:pantothenate kinase type III
MDSELFLDIGNTTLSWSLGGVYQSIDICEFEPKIIPKHSRCLVSCVGNAQLASAFNQVHFFHPKPYQNLQFDYSLSQLGVDRFLALIAAYGRFPKEDIMVIDIGSFVTIDYLKNTRHLSGGITPGIKILNDIHQFSGADSQAAWQFGNNTMLVDYIQSRCNAFQGKILITGGAQKIVCIDTAEYCQNLVIEGLKKVNE